MAAKIALAKAGAMDGTPAFAGSANLGAALDPAHVDSRHLGKVERPINVEVLLLNASALDPDIAMQGFREAHGDFPLYLRDHGIRMDDHAAIDGARHPLDPYRLAAGCHELDDLRPRCCHNIRAAPSLK